MNPQSRPLYPSIQLHPAGNIRRGYTQCTHGMRRQSGLPTLSTNLHAATHSGSASRHSALDRTQDPWPLHSPLAPPLPADRPGQKRWRGEGSDDDAAGSELGEATGAWLQDCPVTTVPLQLHTAPSAVTTHSPPVPQSRDLQPVSCHGRQRKQMQWVHGAAAATCKHLQATPRAHLLTHSTDPPAAQSQQESCSLVGTKCRRRCWRQTGKTI